MSSYSHWMNVSRSAAAVLAVVMMAATAASCSSAKSGPDGAKAKSVDGKIVDPDPSKRRPPATESLYEGVIADAERTMDFTYAIAPEATGADITVTTQTSAPYLSAAGPIIAYIEGRAGRVDGEHVNTYVTGRSGGDQSTRFGVIRSASAGNYSVYHLSPGSGAEVDVVTVTIKLGASRTLSAGEYIDVVWDGGAWRFRNHVGSDTPLPYSGVRDADVKRFADLNARAATI